MAVIIVLTSGHTFDETAGDVITPELLNKMFENGSATIANLPIGISDGGTGQTTVGGVKTALGIPTSLPVPIAEGGTGETTIPAVQTAFGIPSALPVPVAEGGTGAADAATARTNLGVPGIPVAIAEGGTGATDAATARANLGVKQMDYILIRDQKAAGTDGGTFTAGSFLTRDLNTIVADAGGHASLAANQITLAAGTYTLFASAPARQVQNHQAKFINITDAIDFEGTSEDDPVSGETTSKSVVPARFTIAAPKVFELQHRGTVTKSTNGFGSAANFGLNEVYSFVQLWKES